MADTSINLTSNSSGYSYVLTSTTDGNQISGFTTGSDVSVPAPAGSYNIVLKDSVTGAVINTGSVDTSESTDYYAQVKSSSDVATSGVSKTPVTSGQFGSSSTAIQIATPTASSEEFIAPDSNFGKYFTCEDARLYIGDVFIDENIFVQYTLQDNKIPIYGYRSRYYDAMSQGKSIVQGQLGLNFVSEGYLYSVLKEYVKLASTTISTEQERLNSLVYTESQILLRQKTSSSLVSSTSTTVSSQADAAQLKLIAAEKLKLVNKLGASSLDKAQAYVSGLNTPSLSDPSITNYSNAVYQNVAFDLVIQLSGGQRTVTRRLEGCQLIANDQVIDLSGNTLSDGYSFIARRLR